MNIDAVTIKNTGQDGLRFSGNGNTVWNSGSAITRCNISNAGGNGIAVSSITQALLLNNFVHDNAAAGIQLGAARSSVVNNVIQNNTRQQHPDEVIVLTLSGEFTADGVPLTLQSYTAAIIEGAIFVPSPSSLPHVITAVDPSELISISGGLIDLGGRSMEGIFLPGTTLADQLQHGRGGFRFGDVQ